MFKLWKLNNYLKQMKEFNYDLDYKTIDFTIEENRKLYRIGRGEQGVLLVKPYTNDICQHWKFATVEKAVKSSEKIYNMYCTYRHQEDFIGMDISRKFLEMGFTRARRYANHKSGRKYDGNGNIAPQEVACLTNEKAQASKIFKEKRDKVTSDPVYVKMRKQWRSKE